MNFNKVLLYLCVMSGWLFGIWIGDVSDHNLHVYVIDVGQGDAILIRTPDGKNILIDGGGGDYILVELGKVLPPWVRQIDVLILTHPHADHFSGLIDVVERYRIGSVWWNPVYQGMPEYGYFVKLVIDLKSSGVMVVNVNEGDFWLESGVKVEVLWPFSGAGGEYEIKTEAETWCKKNGISCNSRYDGNLNNDSIVILVEFGAFGVLLTGDAEHEVEAELIRMIGMSRLKDVDVLKAGHHCSRTASGIDFLRTVNPEVAVCSCGEGNKFGHPHKEPLDNFEELGIRCFRTDVVGTVHIESNGEWWTVR